MLMPSADRIFAISDEEEFRALAMEIFHYQASENPVYGEYLKLLGKNPSAIESPGEIPFLPGDVILLYTDGVTDAQDAKGRMFELHRLTDALLRNAEKPLGDLVKDILKEIRDFTRFAPQFDDITLVAARRKV